MRVNITADKEITEGVHSNITTNQLLQVQLRDKAMTNSSHIIIKNHRRQQGQIRLNSTGVRQGEIRLTTDRMTRDMISVGQEGMNDNKSGTQLDSQMTDNTDNRLVVWCGAEDAVQRCCFPIGHVHIIPTMQFFTGTSRNTQSKSYMLSLTECDRDFQNIALWDTH